MVHANRTENIETVSSRHLQVKNDGIRICFLYAANGFALESSAIKTRIRALLGNEPLACLVQRMTERCRNTSG